MAVGGSVTGEIDFGSDHDWFAVVLEAERAYRIELTDQRTLTGSTTRAAPALLARPSTTTTMAPLGDVRGAEAGTYYVAVAIHTGPPEGPYTLWVRDVTHTDDFVAGAGTTGAVAVGGSATGGIDYGNDHDWFAVALEADRRYQIDLRARPPGTAPCGIRTCAGSTTRPASSSPARRTTTAAWTATARRISGRRKPAPTTWQPGADGYHLGTYTLSEGRSRTSTIRGRTGTTGAVAVGGSATARSRILE